MNISVAVDHWNAEHPHAHILIFGRLAMTVVALKPVVSFGGKQPTKAQLEEIHHEAHVRCFIANSVKTDVHCEK